jgi:transcriptional regulator with XRE-family HTH domain
LDTVVGTGSSQLAAQVIERREKAGFSQEALAARSGVSRSTVQAIEAGRSVRRANLRAVLETLAEAELGSQRSHVGGPMTIDEFLAQDPNLDELARRHYRQQYDHLVHASQARRERLAASNPVGSGWRDTDEIEDALDAWAQDNGRRARTAAEISDALRKWREAH